MSASSAPRDKVFLVDGTYTVFRSFFAISRLSAPDGTPTNAVFGFLATMRKIVRENAPHYVGVAFDPDGPVHRDERYEAYKANREEPPEDLAPQFEMAMKASRLMGWPVLMVERYEADDVIGTLASKARDAGLEAVIVTADKDLYQLVGEGISVLNPAKERLLDAAGVEEVFGAPPERVVDVLALMGDAVDNVPGVKGIGEKTAKSLVRRYGTLDAIVARAKRFVALLDAADEALAAIKAKDEEALAAPLARAKEEAAALVRLESELEGDEREDLVARFASVAGLEADAGVRAAGKALRELSKKTQPKTWRALVEHEEEARLSLELVTIVVDAPIELELDALEVRPRDYAEAITYFRELGFKTLTAELGEESSAPPPEKTSVAAELEVEILDEIGALRRRVDALLEAGGPLAFDTETDALEPRRAALVGVSFAWGESAGAYVPLGHRVEGAKNIEWEEARPELARLLESDLPKVGQNLRYDLAVLRRAGIRPRALWLDTLVAAQLAEPERELSKRLDDLARRHLGVSMISYEEVAGRGSEQRTLDLVDVESVARYAVEDAVVAWRLAEPLRRALEEADMARLYDEVEGPLVPILDAMEEWGVRVDTHFLSEMSGRMDKELSALEREIHELAGHEFNVNSPPQLRTVLFDELKLSPSGRRTQKTKAHSTGQEVLEALAEQHPLPAKVLEYRELAKLRGTYVDALPKLVDERDGRVHTRFHQLGAATGRLSSSDPNLQNIPIRTAAGRRIREAFVPAEGHLFLSADYSQMELRILAHLSGDEALAEAFRSGQDIHTVTAAAVTGLDPEEVTPELRARAKAVNFGIIYGMSEFRLAREQKMSREDARAFIDAYFSRHPKVRAYIDGVMEEVQQSGEVRTIYGRVRRFPELVAGAEGARAGLNRMQRDTLLRQAVNTTVQGSAADIVKRAMVLLDERIEERGLPARLLLQVHDELLLEVPDEAADESETLLRETMEGAVALRVPLDVQTGRGRSWAESH